MSDVVKTPTNTPDVADLVLKARMDVKTTIDALADAVEVLQTERDTLKKELDADDEEFCPFCAAGVDSSEHHEKCVLAREVLQSRLEKAETLIEQIEERDHFYAARLPGLSELLAAYRRSEGKAQ
jgi:hypothetical protein